MTDEQKLFALEDRVEKNSKQLDYLVHSQQVRWEKAEAKYDKIQEKFKAIYLLLNKNTITDHKSYEAIKSLRASIRSLEESERLRHELITNSTKDQDRKTENIERSTTYKLKKQNKSQILILIGLTMLFFMYIKKDIEAGAIVDAIITLSGASGITAYGVLSNSD